MSDAEEILSEFRQGQEPADAKPEVQAAAGGQPEHPSADAGPGAPPENPPGPQPAEDEQAVPERDTIYVGAKSIMTYVMATLTQLSNLPRVTIKARGRRITQAVDVSQTIVKRMSSVGYSVSEVRISSDQLTGPDNKTRTISTIEIDITKKVDLTVHAV
ncbi:archaeal DNA-binding protein [Cenarchaeum symbiosum A]|uniref:DNA/RNA-binding protein Alba n=1 Tax=Cenarchaeum symbiosum (strain A) TaxID=414004 RepID=A0RUK3_CENSY|nr:archaeal DNA-binding protein [Cenarchaeum symbiosum A]